MQLPFRRFTTSTRESESSAHARPRAVTSLSATALALTALLLPTVARAQAGAPATPGANPPSLLLPYHALAAHGGPLVALSINGIPNQWFIVDTGTGITWLSGASADALHFTRAPYLVGGKAQVDGSGKAMESTSVKLQIGTLAYPLDLLLDTGWMDKIYGDINKVEKLEGGTRLLTGILGTNILRYYCVEVDPSEQMMHLSSGDLTDAYLKDLGFNGGVASGIPITVDPAFGLVTVPVTVANGAVGADKSAAGAPIPMTLDTGASQTGIPIGFALRLQTPALPRLPGAPGTIPPFDIHTNTTIRLGPVALPHFACGVATTDTGAKSGILGMDFLSHFRVLIDFPKQRLYLEPLPSVARYDNPSLRENATALVDGLLLQPTASGDWYIRALYKVSPYAAMGILPGDRLDSIAGNPVAGLPAQEVASRLGQAVTLMVTRHGQQIQLPQVTQ